MKGIILKNAYYSAPFYVRQCERMREELAARGVNAEIRNNDFFPALIDGGKRKLDFDGDFCVYLDKDKYVGRLLTDGGIRLFDTIDSIVACDDKMCTAMLLADHGVPMPKTLPGLLCYRPEARVSERTLDLIESELGYPMIAKTSHGSMGMGVYKIDDRETLVAVTERLRLVPHLFQKFVGQSEGRDLRVIVVGGKTLGGMERIGTDFRSNIGAGGTGKACKPDDEAQALCEKIAGLLGLDYCGIDLLFGKDGYELCEVNSNAFFDGFENVTGIDVAGAYAEHIVRTMNKR